MEELLKVRQEMVKAIDELENGNGSYIVTAMVMAQRNMLEIVENRLKDFEN